MAGGWPTIVVWSIDLLALSSEGLPIVIEAKFTASEETKGASEKASSDLFAQFMQVLSNAVTLRYTWIKSPDFCQAWADSFDSSTASPPTLTDLHVILAANRHYWDKTFHWGDKQKHWKELNPLVTVAQNASYPIYLGTIDEPVAPNPQCQFQVVAWDSLPTPTTNGPIQLP